MFVLTSDHLDTTGVPGVDYRCAPVVCTEDCAAVRLTAIANGIYVACHHVGTCNEATCSYAIDKSSHLERRTSGL